MVKLIFCLRRQPHLTREEFQRYWREKHALLVKKNMPALGLYRYVQNHTKYDEINEAMRGKRGGPEPFDGVVEVWANSAEDIFPKVTTKDRQQAFRELLEDERRFVDLSRSPVFLVEENVVVD